MRKSTKLPPLKTQRNILVRGQSDAGRAGTFSSGTNRMQAARVYSRQGPIGCRACGYILVRDQSDAGRAGIGVFVPRSARYAAPPSLLGSRRRDAKFVTIRGRVEFFSGKNGLLRA
eukprot:494412-Pyramimonas_sp.AAC.1